MSLNPLAPPACVGRLHGVVRRASSWRLAAGAVLISTLAFGGCAQQPQQFAAARHHGKEYFPSSVYGRASRRVVADGQPVPHGGGQYLVGKPYVVAGQTYYPSERPVAQVGYASWYGDAFHGRLTANGEIYDRDGFTAAHPTMPLPSYARVTNLRNNYSMIVRVNDRGPYASNRIMDVSRRVAEALDFKRYGTTRLKVDYVGRASLAGSDDNRLYATLRSDGPARWQGEPTMIASRAPTTHVASLAPYAPGTRSASRIEDQRPEALAAYREPRHAVVRNQRPEAADPERHTGHPGLTGRVDVAALHRQHVDEKRDRMERAARDGGHERVARRDRAGEEGAGSRRELTGGVLARHERLREESRVAQLRRDDPPLPPHARRRESDKAEILARQFAIREMTAHRHGPAAPMRLEARLVRRSPQM